MALPVLIGLLAALMTWGAKVCETHSADSILQVLISRIKLTPYYWGQNRLGSLLPFLAHPISDLAANLQFQVFVRAASAFCIPLLAFFMLGVRRALFVHFGLAVALIFVSYRPLGLLTIFPVNPYGLSALLLLLGLGLHGRGWRGPRAVFCAACLGALASFTLAFFVNLSAGVWMLPIYFLLACAQDRRRNLGVALLLLFAFVAATLHSRMLGPGYSSFEFAWTHYLSVFDQSEQLVWSRWVLVAKLLAVPALLVPRVALGWYRGEPIADTEGGRFAIRVACVFAGCLVFFLVVVHAEWLRVNLFSFRYFMLPAAIIDCLLVAQLVELLLAFGPSRPRWLPAPSTGVLAASLAVACVYAATGPPRTDCAFLKQHAAAGIFARQAVQSDARLVIGDYWIVWPTVFQLVRELDAHRAFRSSEAFGITYRGDVMAEQVFARIASGPGQRALCIENDLAGCRARMAHFARRNGQPPPLVSFEAEGRLPGAGRYLLLRVEAATPG